MDLATFPISHTTGEEHVRFVINPTHVIVQKTIHIMRLILHMKMVAYQV
jgi:hypothetical protein